MSNKLSFLPREIIKALDTDKKQQLESENKLIKIEFQIILNAKYDYTIVYLNDILTRITDNDVNEISSYIKQNCSNTYSQFQNEYPFIELNGTLKKTGWYSEYGNDLESPKFIVGGYVWIYVHDSLFFKFLKEEIKKL